MRTASIVTAYSYSAKFKSYHAKAYVLETGNPGLPATHTFRHTICSGIGDTAQEAIGDAVKACRDIMSRECGVEVEPIEHKGRISAIFLDGLAF